MNFKFKVAKINYNKMKMSTLPQNIHAPNSIYYNFGGF